MEKKYEIFVSSTYTDMKLERERAMMQILRMGHIPVGMEQFTANDRPSLTIIEEKIKKADIYVLMVGSRYGSLIDDKDISYTEYEYDFARKLNKPIFAIVATKKYFFNTSLCKGFSYIKKSSKLVDFKKKVNSKRFLYSFL